MAPVRMEQTCWNAIHHPLKWKMSPKIVSKLFPTVFSFPYRLTHGYTPSDTKYRKSSLSYERKLEVKTWLLEADDLVVYECY